jgi:hypothetical protein
MIRLIRSKIRCMQEFYLFEDIIKEERAGGNFVTVNSFRHYDDPYLFECHRYSVHYLVSFQDSSIEDMEI